MGGSTKTTERSHETSQKDPWAPAIGPLNDIIGQIKGEIGNTGVTANEQGALDTLTANASAGNPYAPQILALASDLFGGGTDFSSRVDASLDALRKSLTPTARGETLDVANNPFYQTVANDVTNRVNGMFAGAGRDLSGANLQSLSRGIAEGTAPLYESERNRQIAAANTLHQADIGATGLLSNLGQTALGNRQAGVAAATAALQARDAGANQMLAAEAMRRGLPVQNIAALENLLVPLAQLGGSSVTDRVTTGEKREPMLKQLTEAAGGLGALGKSGAFGPSGWLMSALGSVGSAFGVSDARVKDDVAEVGALYDGSPVYRFRYSGDPAMRIGLMAQDVEQRRPDAVRHISGLKAVDYGKATELAGILGRLR